uniref:FBA_2 domain-containing protein n=1 Tax=Caenorhabditis tropicalis TaxID=1561998 RepID=A0A1I7T3P0_9PELO
MNVWSAIYSLFFAKPIKDPFPLNRLPDVPRIRIFRLMDGEEQVKLAFSSERMEQYIRIAKIRYFDYCQVQIDKEKFTIELKHSRLAARSGDSIMRFQKTAKLIEKDMKPWLNEESSVMENVLTVTKRLQTTYPCKETGVIFIDNTPSVIKHVLEALDDFIYVSLGGKNLKVEAVDLAMDSFKKGREISYGAVEMPLDYSHPNAFKFVIIYYYDARWVRLENLFSMRGIRSVELERTNLKCEDLNTLLKYWTTSDERMTYGLRIGITQETNIQEKTLFDGLIVLKTVQSGTRVTLLANHRKKLVLNITLEPKNFKVYEYSQDDHLTRSQRTRFTKEYRILEILQKKKELVEDGENWEKIGDKIRQLEEELSKNGVYDVKGIAYVDKL